MHKGASHAHPVNWRFPTFSRLSGGSAREERTENVGCDCRLHHDDGRGNCWRIMVWLCSTHCGRPAHVHSCGRAAHCCAGLYLFATYLNDDRLTLGTGKFGDLAAFTSAIVLALIALLIAYESIDRFINPVAIAFNQAIPIAVAGLGVNLLSAFLLRDGHDHHHPADHPIHAHDDPHESHGHAHVHRDHNLRAAFVHVMADAAVSVLVIIGLVSGRLFGWVWMDPLMGLVATAVILSWSWTLVRSAGAVLLDVCPDPALSRKIAARLEQGSDRISDLHLWRLGPGHLAAVISLVTHNPHSPDIYKRRLLGISGLSHVTIEVLTCPGEHH